MLQSVKQAISKGLGLTQEEDEEEGAATFLHRCHMPPDERGDAQSA
jgi:hypothetical protein